MTTLLDFFDHLADRIKPADWLLSTLARFIFAASLVMYFWQAGITKLGDGPLGFLFPPAGAYAQIFPRATEAVSYDISQLSFFHYLVVVAGTWAEFILPALVVIGLLTRFASLGMLVFLAVQTATDIIGHGAELGQWFDRDASALIADQRMFWAFLLVVLVLKGAGPLSLDAGIRTLRGKPEEV